jgi:FkbM family methyltransferase
MANIYGILRFSVVTNAPEEHWRLARYCQNEYTDILFSDERLNKKLRLLENFTLKSIENNNTENFVLLIIYSSLMPKWATDRLKEISASRDYITIAPMEPTNTISRFSADIVDSLRDKTQPYITFRIDDDDAIDKHFLNKLGNYSNIEYVGKVITSQNGLYLAASGKADRILLRRMTYPNIGIGLALVAGPGQSRTIFNMGNHFHVAKRAEVIVEDRVDTWIRSLYEDSDSQLGRKSIFRRHFKGEQFENLSVEECSDRLRTNFPNIDFAAWRAVLERNVTVPEAGSPSRAAKTVKTEMSQAPSEKQINVRHRSKSLTVSAFANDHISKHIEKFGFYELEALDRVREIYVPGTTIFDVGANIGNHTLYFSKILGARVIAVEPNELALRLLRKNVMQNAVESLVTVVPAGVGAYEGWGQVVKGSERNKGSATLQMGTGQVRVVTLDSLPATDPVSLVKIDVEGMELDVLRGAGGLIDRWLPDLFIEAAEPEHFRAIARHLLDFGYTARARVAFTPTYLFSFHDPMERFARLLDCFGAKTKSRHDARMQS